MIAVWKHSASSEEQREEVTITPLNGCEKYYALKRLSLANALSPRGLISQLIPHVRCAEGGYCEIRETGEGVLYAYPDSRAELYDVNPLR